MVANSGVADPLINQTFCVRVSMRCAPALILAVLIAGCGAGGGEGQPENTVASTSHAIEYWSSPLVLSAFPPELRDVVRFPDRVMLFTICAEKELKGRRPAAEIEALPKLDGYCVLDSTPVSSEEGRLLIDSFLGSVKAGKEEVVMCFRPHHAIRVERGTQTVELLVCFECYNYKVNPNGGDGDVQLGDAAAEQSWRSLVAKYGLEDITQSPEASRTE